MVDQAAVEPELPLALRFAIRQLAVGEREGIGREVSTQDASPSRGPFVLGVRGQPFELMLKLAQKPDRAGELASLLQLA